MHTFFSISPDNLIFELEADITCIVSDDRRVKMIREGIVYQPNYSTMEALSNFYYRGESLLNQGTKLFTFHAVRQLEDYVTDVNGKRVLENRSHSCSAFGDYMLITIELLGFVGSAAQLLQKHGMLYFQKGVNALQTEAKLKRRSELNLGLGR